MRLKRLLGEAKKFCVSVAHREEQRRSFAYGNAKLSNELVTREMVDRAVEEMESVGKT